MSDQVPEQYRGLFTNEEWVQHKFLVWGTWATGAVSVIVHLFIWSMGKRWF
jgi:hypothetical protein